VKFNTLQFAAVITAAKAAAANSPRWLRAIERATAALMNGELIVTVIADNRSLVMSANGPYWVVNGHCQCAAAKAGHRECYHRAAARLVEMYEDAPAVETKSTPAAPVITRSIERDYNGSQVAAVRCNGWMV
jgi:hypothetical protein